VTLRIGIVGCGFVTESRHLPALARIPEVSVVAIADVSTEARTRTAERFGVARAYARAEELAADPAVDLVAVCVPVASHAEVALSALGAGKHVLVEKPLALTLDEADRLVEAADSAPGFAFVGFNLRWHRLVMRGRLAIDAGAVGRVESVVSAFTDSRLGEPGLPDWRSRRELGGGALLDKAIHHVDLWRHLLGDEVEEVFALSRSGESDDETVVVNARLRAGTLATVIASDRTALRNDVRISGDAGEFTLDLYRSDGFALAHPTDLPGAPAARMRRAAGSVRALLGNAREIGRGGVFDASYEAQWRHIARVVAGEERPACTFVDGREALAVVLAASRSAELGEPIAIQRAPAGAVR
jgi:predicted dehydrogenase